MENLVKKQISKKFQHNHEKFSDIKSFKEHRNHLVMEFFKKSGNFPKIGFVPTMGALHAGHLSLIGQAKSECDLVFCSIFVNPKQFAPNEDFDQYPRQLSEDIKTMNTIGGVDGVFAPPMDIMYPVSPTYKTYVTIEKIDELPEGKCRPGFFRGVATVVTKLFNIVEPTHAYFGQKDCLQLIVIKQIVRDLNMNIEIVRCPIVREDSGLALSSRNVYLNVKEKLIAPKLLESLLLIKQLIEDGEHSVNILKAKATDFLNSTEMFNIHYYSFADIETGEEIESELDINRRTVISLAAVLGKTRLIDNIIYPMLFLLIEEIKYLYSEVKVTVYQE